MTPMKTTSIPLTTTTIMFLALTTTMTMTMLSDSDNIMPLGGDGGHSMMAMVHHFGIIHIFAMFYIL